MSPNAQANQSPKNVASAVAAVVPQGTLQRLKVSDIKPNPNNPRMLFDRLPLNDLKEIFDSMAYWFQ